MLTRAEQRSRNRKPFRSLQCLDRRPGGDPAVERDLDRVVRGGWHHWLWSGCNRCRGFRQLQNLERSGPVRQPSDEPSLFKSRDQPMNPRLRLEVERLAHLVEAWTYTGIVQALVDEEEQFMLLGREHRVPP